MIYASHADAFTLTTPVLPFIYDDASERLAGGAPPESEMRVGREESASANGTAAVPGQPMTS
jgi:hypothetical protein